MNIKAIIASLVLGSSSAAMAAPAVTVTASAHVGGKVKIAEGERHVVRAPQPVWRPTHGRPIVVSPPVMSPPIWVPPAPVVRAVTLADDMAFTSEGRRFITVGAQAGTFSKLDLRGSMGRTFIQQVYVQFDNGQEQVVRGLDRTLTANDCLSIDLDGNRRAIRRIVVYGYNLDNGFRHEANAFDVVAS